MQVSRSVHILKHDFAVPVAPGRKMERFVYSIVIFGEQITLIDSGVKGSQARIFDYIQKQGRSIEEIKLLILSHSHPDHIGSARRIQVATGCRILAHAGERTWIEHIEAQNAARPVPGFFELVEASVSVDGLLEDGARLDLQHGLSLTCLHTPGHSKGSVSVLIPEEKVLFTGDCIPVARDIPNYDDFKDMRRSLARLKEFRDLAVMLSSWAEPVCDKAGMAEAIQKGENYLAALDAAVKKHYAHDAAGMECCRNVLAELGLPPIFALPMVHKAFLSHAG